MSQIIIHNIWKFSGNYPKILSILKENEKCRRSKLYSHLNCTGEVTINNYTRLILMMPQFKSFFKSNLSLMKKSSAGLFLLLFAFNLFAQSDTNLKSNKWEFGFDAGVNYLIAITDDSFNQYHFMQKNGEAVHVGIVSNYNATDHISISPKVELSFHETSIEFNDATTYSYQIMPISIDLMMHFDFNFKTGQVAPFIYAGPNLKIALTPVPSTPTQFRTGNDLALDFGAGLKLEKFGVSFVPNFRYSMGLLNVNEYPAVESLKLRYVYFGVNFMI